MYRSPLLAAAFGAALLFALGAAADTPPQSGASGEVRMAERRFNGWQGPKPVVDCSCRHQEGRAELGATICILQGSRRVLARCEKSLNVPFWRVLQDDCSPTS